MVKGVLSQRSTKRMAKRFGVSREISDAVGPRRFWSRPHSARSLSPVVRRRSFRTIHRPEKNCGAHRALLVIQFRVQLQETGWYLLRLVVMRSVRLQFV